MRMFRPRSALDISCGAHWSPSAAAPPASISFVSLKLASAKGTPDRTGRIRRRARPPDPSYLGHRRAQSHLEGLLVAGLDRRSRVLSSPSNSDRCLSGTENCPSPRMRTIMKASRPIRRGCLPGRQQVGCRLAGRSRLADGSSPAGALRPPRPSTLPARHRPWRWSTPCPVGPGCHPLVGSGRSGPPRPGARPWPRPGPACRSILSWARCIDIPASLMDSEMPDTASPILVCASAAV